ncbi:YncE family protein [Flammeovirga kamogawensis]|nr:DUF5074 domain-containing protein [Flammeovirga kamogawensis]
MQRLFFLYFFVFLSFFQCNTPQDAMPISDTAPPKNNLILEDGLFVLNEGNFDWGHGTLSHKKYDSDTVNNEIYKAVNDFEIGNVAQSMTIIGEKGYICVNNSGRIDIIEAKTSKWLGRIEIPKSSPRYLLPISNTKAYVTDLYADYFYVIDLKEDEVIKNVRTSGWTEKLALVDKFAYITQTRTVYDNRKGGQLLLKIDIATDDIIDSLALPYGPIDLVVDKNNMLWVLSNGGLSSTNNPKPQPAICQIDPGCFCIKKQFNLDSENYLSMPSRLRINKEKDRIYYLQKDVFSFSIDATSLPKSPIIYKEKRLFYGLGISPRNNDIYVTDAIDYVQKGWVFKYNEMGVKLDSFKVGVIPNELIFQ